MADQNITGGRELDAFLQQFSAKFEKKVMRGALRVGANEFKEEVKANIPVDSGALRRSVRVTTNAKGGRVTASVKIGNKKAWYAQMVEFGTRAHKITPRGAKALRIAGYVVADADHPGARPRPFARPAFDARAARAATAVGTEIRSRLTAKGINLPDAG
ncbi:HK97-gp10 family putative phage morphogenesis protein [Massilia violaceinigra]|nr:HK97-gp10 family putative phage morphogenesis protein [Massilia violaceinigra]